MGEQRRSFCRICAAACGIVVEVEGDRVVGIAAFRTGLAERGGIGDNGDPAGGPAGGADGQPLA